MNSSELEFFVLDTDARSRIAIYMINHADSPLIAQLGNLSHDAFRGGFISGDGCMAVSGDASCILLSSILPFPEPLLIGTAMLPSPVSSPMGCDMTASDERICPLTPGDMPHLLSSMTGQNDFIFLCRRLGLDKEDYDNLKTGIFTSTIVDNLMERIAGWKWLPIRDHTGSFVRMNVLFQDAVFEFKFFKYVTRREVYGFRFKPEHSGIWFRDGVPAPGETIILDTSIPDVWNRTSPANAGLIDAGDVSEIDEKLFLGRETQCVWRHDAPQSRNDFSKALSLLSIVMKIGAKGSILKYSSSTQKSKVVELSEIIKQARCYGLDIPTTLKDTGYIHLSTPQENYIPHDIPAFWSKGSATLFFGPGFRMILEKLVKAFSRIQDTATNGVDKPDNRSRFPSRQVGIYYQASTESRIKKMIGNTGLCIPCISSAISLDELETALYQKAIQVLFIPYAEKIPAQVLADVLDLCELKGVVVGMFSRAEGKNGKSIPEDVLSDTTKELVAQCYLISTDGDAVIARDVTTGTTKRYFFEDDGKFSIADENNINNTNRKEI